MAYRVTTYKQAFALIDINFDDKMHDIIKALEAEGHTEKSISFSIWKSQDKLIKFSHDGRFYSIFINEVRKWSWGKGDPRWNRYWEKKNAAKQLDEKLNKATETKAKIGIDRDGQVVIKQGYVYFIQGENGGAIKIGFSYNPKSRLKQLQTGYPDILKILHVIPGDEDSEKVIHEKLKDYRLNGEWFKPVRAVLDEIKMSN